jgi:hypothetical protein
VEFLPIKGCVFAVFDGALYIIMHQKLGFVKKFADKARIFA